MPRETAPASPTSSTAAEFAEAVGRAVLAWQHVELRCAHLYVWLLDARNAQGALASFHAVHSQNVRTMMLKTAAHYLLQSPEFEDLGEDFETLMDNLGEYSRLRNRLTHSEVAEEMTEAGWSFQLKAPAVETVGPGKGRQRPKLTPLDFAAVSGAESQFRGLAESLYGFEEQLRERLESL